MSERKSILDDVGISALVGMIGLVVALLVGLIAWSLFQAAADLIANWRGALLGIAVIAGAMLAFTAIGYAIRGAWWLWRHRHKFPQPPEGREHG